MTKLKSKGLQAELNGMKRKKRQNQLTDDELKHYFQLEEQIQTYNNKLEELEAFFNVLNPKKEKTKKQVIKCEAVELKTQ